MRFGNLHNCISITERKSVVYVIKSEALLFMIITNIKLGMQYFDCFNKYGIYK